MWLNSWTKVGTYGREYSFTVSTTQPKGKEAAAVVIAVRCTLERIK